MSTSVSSSTATSQRIAIVTKKVKPSDLCQLLLHFEANPSQARDKSLTIEKIARQQLKRLMSQAYNDLEEFRPEISGVWDVNSTSALTNDQIGKMIALVAVNDRIAKIFDAGCEAKDFLRSSFFNESKIKNMLS